MDTDRIRAEPPAAHRRRRGRGGRRARWARPGGLVLAAVLALVWTPGAGPAAGAASERRFVVRNPAQAVLWRGAAGGSGTPQHPVAACAAAACDHVALAVDLPDSVWRSRPGGLQVAIRWSGPGDNLRLYVLRGGTLVASSTGIVSLAQSVLIPAAANGTYDVYVAYDPDSPSPSVAYEGLAEVEFQTRPNPVRPLLPDLTVRPTPHVTFDTSSFDFFEPPPPPGHSCFTSEAEETGATTCLRFDQVLANVGEGPLELRFAIPHGGGPTAQVSQRIYWSDGRQPATERHVAGGTYHPVHDHYHYDALALTRLWATDGHGRPTGDAPVRSGRKVGYCLADIVIDAWGQKGDGPRTYNAPDCFFPAASDATSDYLVQGVTPGFADVYEWYVPGQYVEVTGVPDGLYVLETVADPDDTILEADETNNCNAVLIRLTTSNGPPHVETLGPGPRC